MPAITVAPAPNIVAGPPPSFDESYGVVKNRKNRCAPHTRDFRQLAGLRRGRNELMQKASLLRRCRCNLLNTSISAPWQLLQALASPLARSTWCATIKNPVDVNLEGFQESMPRSQPSHLHDSGASLSDDASLFVQIAWFPALIEERLGRAIETNDREVAFARHCTQPVFVFTG